MAAAFASEVRIQHTFLYLHPVEEEDAQTPRLRAYSDSDIAGLVSWEDPASRALLDDSSTTGSWADSSDSLESTCGEGTLSSSVCDAESVLELSDVEEPLPDAAVVPVVPIYFDAMACQAERTTVMLKNLPNKMTRVGLAELIDSKGFAGRYDFLYVPIDFKSCGCFGYGWVNMLSGDDAQQLMGSFEGFSDWSSDSRKVCAVEWARRQGLPALLEHFRDSELMHEAVPDEYRPATFHEGQQVPMPTPTRQVHQPDLRVCRSRKEKSRKGRRSMAKTA
jgi:hypothetical protein